ncbi:MAG: hypothetical protein LBP58_01185 [Azoarcus sp.]|jgi:hypothetical protein|nr:hypothetical protein [Azoarcus sp.]
MRIRLLKQHIINGRTRPAGAVVDVEARLALDLVKAGMAEMVPSRKGGCGCG